MTAPLDSADVLAGLRDELTPDLEPIRLLGEGAVGHVYLAREPALRRLVAVKVLRAELGLDDLPRRRFEREARAAAAVSHPNVTAIHRLGHLTDGRPFLVMEYIDGRTLEDRLTATGPLPEELTVTVLIAVAAGLMAAHGQGVVHRDVRPGNVMIEAGTDRVVLMDFGIAALLETGAERITRLTEAGVRLGDPQHMSPEQLRGDPVTPAADLWGFGVLGYELLTGQRPFGGSDVLEVLKAVLDGETPHLETLRPGTDPRLAALLRTCFSRGPGRRPRADEALAELRRIGAPLRSVRPPSTSTPAPDPRQPSALPNPSAMPEPLSDFLRELMRRKVYRVAVAYGAGAFLVLQGADLVTPVLSAGDSEFWYRLTVALTMAGFPVALVLSWVFDI
ncbi:MAG TPA: serine/threonine-protein kinase, partial [Longimicrobiales bacterium]|nr:serine/threonine-protein kinase [Longimicrobiales bacterium]